MELTVKELIGRIERKQLWVSPHEALEFFVGFGLDAGEINWVTKQLHVKGLNVNFDIKGPYD